MHIDKRLLELAEREANAALRGALPHMTKFVLGQPCGQIQSASGGTDEVQCAYVASCFLIRLDDPSVAVACALHEDALIGGMHVLGAKFIIFHLEMHGPEGCFVSDEDET